MIAGIVKLFAGMPTWLATMIMAGLPFGELRLAMPVAIAVFKLPPWLAYLLAIIGNLLPFFIIYFGLNKVYKIIDANFPRFLAPLDRVIEKAKKKVERHYAVYGAIGLFFFTAIPLPMTGLYTATIAAVVFDIPFWPSFLSIFAGVIVAGLIVLALTLTGGAIF
jgi:uncharacterized membrane protein